MLTNNIELTGIFVKDAGDNGYTAFFAQFPNIIAEGDTEEEATENLIHTVQTVFQHQKNLQLNQSNIITKQFNLSLSTQL